MSTQLITSDWLTSLALNAEHSLNQLLGKRCARQRQSQIVPQLEGEAEILMNQCQQPLLTARISLSELALL
jgi:hypothetical protein